MSNPSNETRELALLLGEHLWGFSVVDVGAHGTQFADIYEPALSLPDARCIGFDFSRTECDRLNKMHGTSRRYLPLVIGDGRIATFYECRAPLVSSIFSPNLKVSSQFEGLQAQLEVLQSVEVVTSTLDSAVPASNLDFMKIDVQGGTLPTLQGATRLLENTLVVHAETEFVELYNGESLFSECEIFLRQRGFMFHHFHGMEGRRMTHGEVVVGKVPSQLLWADAVFVPSLDRLDTLEKGELIRLAFAMQTFYGATDLAMACLSRTRDSILNASFRQHLHANDLLQ